MKLYFLIVLITFTLAACGGSSDDSTDIQDDQVVAGDDGAGDGTGADDGTGANDGAGTGADDGAGTGVDDGAGTGVDDGTGDGADDGTDTGENDPVADMTPLEALELSSRINSAFYEQIISDVTAIESVGRYESGNYLAGISAAAAVTRGEALFARAELLALIEQQILTGDSPLDFLNITEGGFNRVHLCPGGGRLLAVKSDALAEGDISGSFAFEDCEIGSIFINGAYSTLVRGDLGQNVFATASISMSQLRIDGADGISTTNVSSVSQTASVVDDNTGGYIFTTVTQLRDSLTIGIANVGILANNVTVITEEVATSDDFVDVGMVLDSESLTVNIGGHSVSVLEDTTNVTQNLAAPTSLAQETGGVNFAQGELDFTLRPNTNRLTVQVANGDPATFDAIILEPDNSVVSFVVPWAPNFEFGSSARLPVLFTPR